VTDTPNTVRREHGHHLEDFPAGRVFEHHWGRTFTLHDTIWFSTMTMNYNPVHFDAPYAESLGYAGIPINPLLVYTTVLGLSVEDLSELGGPFLGIDDMSFPTVVYPGDTVTARSEVISSRVSASRPGWGIATWRTTGVNQRGETVCRYLRTNLARARPTPDRRPLSSARTD
jgi:acyl dehydratase